MSEEKKSETEIVGGETPEEVERRPAWRPQDADREYFRYET